MLKNQTIEETSHRSLNSKVSTAGRVVSFRRMGNVAFAHLADSTGRLQVCFRRDDVGGADIYMSTFKDGHFQAPVNLGPEINTAGEEQSPFIHYDNQTLYFSSEGHPGVGGGDIFITKKNAEGKFGAPLNIGYPINSEKDELGFIVDRLGRFGYLSSERPGGYGGLDIYKFELPKSLKPEPVSYVSGVVFDAITLEKIESEIELTDLATGQVIIKTKSQKGSGAFFMVLKSNRNYMLTIDQTNYLFYSANFALK
jgi:hypothetical protein